MTIMADQGPVTERLWLPSEVAAIFRVEPDTVRGWLRTGKLASISTPGGRRRVRDAEVRAKLAEEASA